MEGRIGDDEADRMLPELRVALAVAKAELDACGSKPDAIALHPAAVAHYLVTVEDLRAGFAVQAEARTIGATSSRICGR